MQNLVEELKYIQNRFDTRSNNRKHNLLLKLSRAKTSSLKTLKDYHSSLLFLSAYPPAHPKIDALISAELHGITGKISREDGWQEALVNTGLALTRVESNFSLPIVEWIRNNYGSEIKLLSTAPDESFTQLVMRKLLLLPEKEILEAGVPSLTEWLRKFSKHSGGDELGLLLNLLKSETSEENAELIFENLKVFVSWNLFPGSSLTFNRGLNGNTFHHDTDPILQTNEGVFSKPLPKSKALTETEKEQLINSARNTLCSLLRETDPVTYTQDVELVRLERGYDIALFYMKPPYRLGLESYVGYMAYKNSVPYAYGGGWIFMKRCKIGINVFPHVRGGESSYFFQQLMRVYHKQFGADTFIAEPYQVGKGNSDGIKSGAFWFYYRHGFTPENTVLQKLADKTFRATKNKKELLNPVLLKKLVQGNIVKHIKKNPPSLLPDPYLINEKITSFISRNFEGNRKNAVEEITRQLRKFNFAEKKKKVIEAYAPLLIMLNCSNWEKEDLQNLFTLLYEKSYGNEKLFIQGITRHKKFIEEISKIQKL